MEAAADVVLTAFRKVWLWDATTSRPGRVAEYQSLFPGHEDLVAAEYERLSSEYPSEEDARAAGKSRVGPYRLDGFLGRGGQGAVYAATDTRDGRVVALKVLAAEAGVSERRLARLRREAEAVARVDHPGICRIHEAGLDGDVPYLALHLVPGRTLAETIGRARRESPAALATIDAAAALAMPTGDESSTGEAIQRVARFFEEAARAVHAAHEAGLVHRDVKPGNLMITPAGAPVVLDFGLARDEEEGRTITATGALLGTPGYMAPEQTAPGGGRIDRRVDVYALGVSLFEALTLMHPFEAPTLDAAARAGLLHDAKDLRRLDPRFPRDLALVVATAMRRDRDRRYLSALALAQDLLAFRTGRPVRARPPTVRQRLGDGASRLAALAGGLAVSMHLVGETRKARADADVAKEDARKARERGTKVIQYAIGDLQRKLSAAGQTGLLEDVAAKAVEYVESIPLDEQSDAELATTAYAWSTLSLAYERQGRRAEQIRCREKELVIRERLHAKSPSDPSAVHGYAESLWWRARRQQGEARLAEALATYRKADGLFADLTGEMAEMLDVRQNHMVLVRMLGVLERRLSMPESLATLRRSCALGELLVADRPDDAHVRFDLTLSVIELSVALGELGDSTEASALSDETTRRAREIALSHPDEPFAKAGLADALMRDADCAHDRGDFERACAAAAEVRDIYEALSAHDPLMDRWRNFFVIAHERLVHALLAADRDVEALRFADAGSKLMEPARKAPIAALDSDALVRIARFFRTYAAALRRSGALAEAFESLAVSSSYLEHGAATAPDDANVQFGLVLQHQELAAALTASAASADPSDGPAAQDAARRALAALAEGETIARRELAAHADAARFARQRAFLLRDGAAVRRMTGDAAGAVAALEDAVRIRDDLAARDPAFVARLADLDALLADARRRVEPGTK